MESGLCTRLEKDPLVNSRTIVAARNNADWYEVMFQAHGLRYRRSAFAFVAEDEPPPYYSKLTVLSPDHNTEVLRELADLASRLDGIVGLKDSFRSFDLGSHGFQTLFDATWIWREPQPACFPTGWEVVEGSHDLSMWEAAWKRNGSPTDQRMFPDALLSRRDVIFLGRKTSSGFVAGCIASLSSDCVGLSNVFADNPSENTFAEAANAVNAAGISRPIVGYEAGTELQHAIQAGFVKVGDLRILEARHATF